MKKKCPKKRKTKRYRKPPKDSKAIAYFFDHGKKCHIKTNNFDNGNSLNDKVKRISGKEYMVLSTGETRQYHYKELQDPNIVFAKAFNYFMNLTSNFERKQYRKIARIWV